MNSLGAYAVYNNQLALVGGTDEESSSNGLDHSPSCRAVNNACGFPLRKDVDVVEGVLEALVRGPVLKLARCMGAVRHFVACARPRRRYQHHHSSRAGDRDVEEEARVMLRKSLSITEGGEHREADEKRQQKLPTVSPVMSLECMKMELLAVLRHLEVRWQLFNEAMTKWCDLEAMLAFCTDNVTWSGGSGTVISGKNSPLLSENWGSLLNRKLSYDFGIEQVTRLSPKVLPDMSLDRDGNCVELEDSELRKASATLDKLLGSRKNGVYSEDGWLGPYMVLEKDWYALHDAQGKIVEQGTRTVLWKQHNSTWYIRACIVNPTEKKP